jgi:ECF-type transporter family protein
MKDRFSTTYIARTGLLLALALIFQIGFRYVSQPLVGPMVNFTLIIGAGLVGTTSGVIVGCLTPLIAFFFGIMPLFPLVPFVMIGNSLFVLIFNIIRRNMNILGDIAGVTVAALVKSAFLAISVRYLVTLIVPKIPSKIIVAFSLPQLYTALIGGFLAIIIIKLIRKGVKLR